MKINDHEFDISNMIVLIIYFIIASFIIATLFFLGKYTS